MHSPEETPPPVGGTWTRIYIAIAIYTAALVLVLYWMTVAFEH